jgi:outer membrane lipoprotein carrier protein
MKIKLAFLLSCFLSLSLSAQNVDGGATEILKNLSVKYRGFTSMSIDYTYKAEKNKQVTDTQKGEMIIKGNKYYFTFSNQVFYCNGVTVWNYQKVTNEVSVYEYDESDDDMLNPAKLLANWQKDYRPKFIREENNNGKFVNIIDLTPIKAQSYYKIRFYIDKVRNEILRIGIYEKDNSIYSYFFDKFVTNTSIDDTQFTFDTSKHPNVEINDMR